MTQEPTMRPPTALSGGHVPQCTEDVSLCAFDYPCPTTTLLSLSPPHRTNPTAPARKQQKPPRQESEDPAGRPPHVCRE